MVMKRKTRAGTKFDLLHAIDRLAREQGIHIREPTALQTVFDELRRQFAAKQVNDIFFHGHRVETLFAYVAASLGKCRVIKAEDAGELYSSIETLRVPDFRIVTTDGRQIMVEVKNCHTADPCRRFELDASYLDGLRTFASTFGAELFVAIYWSRAKQWSLLAPEDLENLEGSSCAGISMLHAMQRSRMTLLGDRMIGTIPILVLRLIVSPGSGHAGEREGEFVFRTASAELYCGKALITDPKEQQIAWFLMNNGRWRVTDSEAEFDGERLVAAKFLVAPLERANPDQDFEIVGSLSELIARQFDDATTVEGEITNISPESDPSSFGVEIPENFKGTALRLWQFDLRPSGSRLAWPPRQTQED